MIRPDERPVGHFLDRDTGLGFLFVALVATLALAGFTMSEIAAIRSRLSVVYVSPSSQLSPKVPRLAIAREDFSLDGKPVKSADLPRRLSTLASGGTELIVEVAPDAPGYRVTAGLNAASRAGFTNVALRMADDATTSGSAAR